MTPLILAVMLLAADQPPATCTVTPTVDDQYFSSCGPPAEPSHTHDASPS